MIRKNVILKHNQVRSTPATKRNTRSSAARSSKQAAFSSEDDFDDYDVDGEPYDKRNTLQNRGSPGAYDGGGVAVVVSVRLDPAFKASLDVVAKRMGWTRTATLLKMAAGPLGLMAEAFVIADATKAKPQTPPKRRR